MSSGSKTQSSNTSTTQGTQTNATDPAQLGILTGNYTGAQSAVAGPATYQGDMTAPFNPTQIQAQGVLSSAATDPTYGMNATNASNAAQGVLTAGDPLAGANLQKYMNPFTTDVVNASIAQNERARQTAQTNDSQQATASNAFGGSRSGVMAALTNGQYDQNDQANIANLNSANYSQAQNAAINSGNFTLNAASTAANLNNNALQTATTQGGVLSAVGDAQQQQQQAALTSAYQNWAAGKQLTIQEQQLLNQTLGLFPNQQTVSTSGSGSGTGTSSTTTNPGLTGVLGSLGSLGEGLGSMGVMMSDRRTKSDVRTLRHDARGRRWVSFRYNWEPEGTRHEGVIAQEILKSDPHAVHVGADGFYRVDYDALKEAA